MHAILYVGLILAISSLAHGKLIIRHEEPTTTPKRTDTVYVDITENCQNKECKGVCPSDYVLTKCCDCELLTKSSQQCDGTICKLGLGLNSHCDCVPLKRDSVEKCEKTCPSPLTLNGTTCKCDCKRECHGHWTLDSSVCDCVCLHKCPEGLYLDSKKCQCIIVDCPLGEQVIEGKCVAVVKEFCNPGELLIESVCVQKEFCPPGYKKLPNRICQRQCCSGDCPADEKQCMPESCGKDKYLIEGKCKEVVVSACPESSFFDFLKPSCIPTCEEPIPLKTCNKTWTGPGCNCHRGFLYHNGECVHPDRCPNKPLCLKDADFLIMLDSSSTVRPQDFALMKAFAESLVQQMVLDEGDCHRVAIVQYGFTAEAVFHFDSFGRANKQDYLKAIQQLDYKGGNAYFGEALRHVRTQVFHADKGLRHAVPRILILMTDGSKSDGQLNAELEARDLREEGIQIVIIKVGGEDTSKLERLYDIAGEGGKVFVFGLRDYRDINMLLDRIISFQCTDYICPAPRLKPQHCDGEFRMYDRQEFVRDGFQCRLVEVVNATKRRCACPEPQVNISECVDNYQNITKTTFVFNSKDFICEAKQTNDRQLCSCPPTAVEEGNCTDQRRTVTITNYTLQMSGDSGRYCQKMMVSNVERCGCQPDVENRTKCTNGFQMVHSKTYRFVRNAEKCVEEEREYEERCSCPTPEVKVHPCDGKEVVVSVHVSRMNHRKECITDTYIDTEGCKPECNNQTDIGIIVDTSSATKPTDYGFIKAFLKRLVGTFPIGLSATQVALMTYSSKEEIRLISNFRAYVRVSTVQERIDEITFQGGKTNTAHALKTYRETALLEVQGSRLNDSVPQIVYLITDGSSTDDQDALDEAEQLKDLGVKIIIISIKNPNYLPIAKNIVSEPANENLFAIENFDELVDRVDDIAARRCAYNKDANPEHMRRHYVLALRQMHLRNQGRPISNLSSAEFSNLTRQNHEEYCATYFIINNATLSDLAGKGDVERLVFKNRLRDAIARDTKQRVFEIIQMNLGNGQEANTVDVDFRSPCNASYAFAELLLKDKFAMRDNSNNTLQIVKNATTVISPFTTSIVQLTEDADVAGREAFELLLKYNMENTTFVQDVRQRLRNSEVRLVYLQGLLRVSEERALGLALEIQRDCLRLLKDVERGLLYISDPLERKDAESRIVHKVVIISESIQNVTQLYPKAKAHVGKLEKLQHAVNETTLPSVSSSATTQASNATVSVSHSESSSNETQTATTVSVTTTLVQNTNATTAEATHSSQGNDTTTAAPEATTAAKTR